ncbi:MAG: tetraacyldisaccharide 4'-kinase [Candidatus Omnitrophota bacterium]
MKPKDLIQIVLAPFSFIFFSIIYLRNLFYDIKLFKAHEAGLKVISVGNITWGGTGKTPSVIYITELLLEKNKRPAILIRGYGDDEHKLFPKLLGEVPVFVGKNRVSSAKKALSRGSIDTLVLDDGFQHRRLKRDLDIVCIDSLDPFGNGFLIPAGILREGISSLKRAHIFLITKTDLYQDKAGLESLESDLKKINPSAAIFRAVYEPKALYSLKEEKAVELSELKNKNLALVSAIASPKSFERTISGIGLTFSKHFIFRDHHPYTIEDLKEIDDYYSRNKIDSIIITEKDAVKLRSINYKLKTKNYLVLGIELKIIENESKLHDRLFSIYNS